MQLIHHVELLYFRFIVDLEQRYPIMDYADSLGIKYKFFISYIGFYPEYADKLILMKLRFSECLEPVDEYGKALWQ